MKKILSTLVICVAFLSTGVLQAQETERELTREEKKEMQAKLDSLLSKKRNKP